jgi:hypothetical protein
VDRHEARALLGVRPGAGRDEVDRAFRRAARFHHPDHGGDPSRFRSVVLARQVLMGADVRPAFGRVVIVPSRSIFGVLEEMVRLMRSLTRKNAPPPRVR